MAYLLYGMLSVRHVLQHTHKYQGDKILCLGDSPFTLISLLFCILFRIIGHLFLVDIHGKAAISLSVLAAY